MTKGPYNIISCVEMKSKKAEPLPHDCGQQSPVDVAGAGWAEVKESNAYNVGGCCQAANAKQGKDGKVKCCVDGARRGVGFAPCL